MLHWYLLQDLNILCENIEDYPNNETRFLVISQNPAKPTGNDKTSILVTTAHKPGALVSMLDAFRQKKINLTYIDSRPNKKQNWEYNFFIDAQGHIDDAAMKAALEAARQHATQLVVLGSYPQALDVMWLRVKQVISAKPSWRRFDVPQVVYRW